MAFGVRNTNTGEPLMDPDLVELVPYLEQKSLDHQSRRIPLQFHKCSPTDYLLFNEPNPNQSKLIESAKSQNFFYCISNHDIYGNPLQILLGGRGEHYAHRSLDLLFRPCVPTMVD